MGFLRLLTLARVEGEEHLGLAGYEGQLGGDAGAAGGELNADQGARGSFSKELLALLHCIVARAAAELEPRLLAVLRVSGSPTSACVTRAAAASRAATFRDIFRLNLPQKTKARCQ